MVLTTEKADGIFSSAFSKREIRMKKYLILSDTVADSKKLTVGDIVELSEAEGNTLVGYNKAELYLKKETKKTSDRSVGLETSKTPKLKKRKSK